MREQQFVKGTLGMLKVNIITQLSAQESQIAASY